MQRALRIPLSFLLLAAGLAPAASGAVRYEFKQVTKSDIESIPSGDLSGRVVLDGARSRVDFLGGSLYRPGTYVIALDSARRMMFVDPSKKRYSEINASNAAPPLSGTDIKISNLHADLQNLDDHPIIAGYRTNHVRLQTTYDITIMFDTLPLKQSVNTIIDKWVTTAFGDAGELFLVAGAAKTGNPDLDKLIDAEAMKVKGVPLKQVITIATGSDVAGRNSSSKLQLAQVRKQNSELVVTDIREVKTEETDFQVPPAYIRQEKQSSDTPDATPVHMLSMEPAP
jgi:hypothetical protein